MAHIQIDRTGFTAPVARKISLPKLIPWALPLARLLLHGFLKRGRGCLDRCENKVLCLEERDCTPYIRRSIAQITWFLGAGRVGRSWLGTLLCCTCLVSHCMVLS